MTKTHGSGDAGPLGARRSLSPGIIPPRAIVAIIAAVALNLLIFWIGAAVGATGQVDSPYPDDVGGVLGSTAIPMLFATVVASAVAGVRPGFPRFAAWAGAGIALATAVMPTGDVIECISTTARRHRRDSDDRGTTVERVLRPSGCNADAAERWSSHQAA